MNIIFTLIKKLLRRSKHRTPSVDATCIIPRHGHTVSKTDISTNAIKVLTRLNQAGYEAYLVGGSVRDLLLRKSPKDFDIATNATPNQIKHTFRNARIIGRRFKLAHIIYHREVIEVSTFRKQDDIEADHKTDDHGMLIRDNVYGTLHDDAFRRDFTVNSLYYNVEDGSIIDLTGGVDDISHRLVRMIGDPATRYQEDPVRMLRAIRFSAKLQFTIEPKTAEPILTLNRLISHVSNSRLFDEVIKLYQCGEAESAHRQLIEYGLFERLFPQTAALLDSNSAVNPFIILATESTDMRIRDHKPVTPAFIYAVLLWFPLLERTDILKKNGMDPLPALDKAMAQVIAEQNRITTIPKRYTQVMREIWVLQYRLPRRTGGRAHHFLEHPRFRAAYDFLALRALAGNESMELAQWWTTFQDADAETQAQMIEDLPPMPNKSARKKRKTGSQA